MAALMYEVEGVYRNVKVLEMYVKVDGKELPREATLFIDNMPVKKMNIEPGIYNDLWKISCIGRAGSIKEVDIKKMSKEDDVRI